MPKQVWKCEYCSRTSEDIRITSQHERKCDYNVKNEKCPSCSHNEIITNISGTYSVCNTMPSSKVIEMEENIEEKCDKWEEG